MEFLDISKFRRSDKDILNCFKVNDKNTVVTKDISIIFPELFLKKDLCVYKDAVKLLCLFAIVDKQNNLYAKTCLPIMHNFTPSEKGEVMVGEECYIELKFYKGDIFVPDNVTIKESHFLYTMFDVFFIQGKVPFYLEYRDLAMLFLECTKYTGVKGVGDSVVVNEVMTSLVARDKNDLDKLYKTTIKTPDDSSNVKFIGLNDTFFGFDNTTSRLIGNYLKDCVISSTIDPDKEPNKIGHILQQ